MSPRDDTPKPESDDALAESSKKLKHISSIPKGNSQDTKDMKEQAELEKGATKRRQKR